MKLAHFEAADVIGIVAILGCLGLIALGKNGTISNVLLVIVGYYFGAKGRRR